MSAPVAEAPVSAPNSAGEVNNAPQSSPAGDGGYGTDTKIATVADLRKKAPKVWLAMLQAIAQEVCFSVHRHNERLIKIMREGSN